MTDLELTERVAKWCGNKCEIDPALPTIVWMDDEEFNPLYDWNDLMMVLEKLLRRYDIILYQDLKDKQLKFSIDSDDRTVKYGSLSDLPRAVCELVASLEKEEMI